MALPPAPVAFANNSSNANSTTVTANVGTTTPRSGTLLVVVGESGSPNATSVTDSRGNIYTLVTASGTNEGVQAWVCVNATQLVGGVDTVTATWASASTQQKNVCGVFVPGAIAVDVGATNNGFGATATLSGGTPGFINELALCIIQGGSGTGEITSPAGYPFFAGVFPPGGAPPVTALYWSWLPTPSAQTLSAALNGTAQWSMLLVTFRVTPVASAPSIPFFPAGYEPQQADFTAWWYNQASFFQGKTVFRGIQAAASQTLANNANATLRIDSVLEDPYGGWVPASFGWVPPFSGYYKAIVCAQVAAVTTGPAMITAGVGAPYNETPGQSLASAAHPTGASGEFDGYWVGGGSQLIIPVAGLWNGPAAGVSTSIAAGEQSSFEIIWLSS